MVRSMTGYGRACAQSNGYDILVEIKSVNHRYYEFSSRIPRSYAYLEEKLKSMLASGYAARGKVDVSATIRSTDGGDTAVSINEKLAGEYAAALRKLKCKLKLKDDLSLSAIAKFGDIFSVTKAVEDADFIWETVKPVAEEAFTAFVRMRETEGEKLKEDILSRLDAIGHTVTVIEQRWPETVNAYRERLYAKIKETLGDREIDDQRVLTEVAIFADKIAVDEETVRLKSHIAQVRDMLINAEEPIGRKLDFIVQEMNREINTTGSKAQDIEIARMVVDVKAQIEKIREQIQNIE